MKDDTRQLELDMGSIINHSEYQASTEIVEDSNISIKKVSISSVTEINPRFSSRLDPNEIISFVPMAAVSEKSVSIENSIDRPYSEVAKGFTPFQRGDILVAKITPCFENGKMAYAENLPREFGFGSTEFHVLRVKNEVYGSYLFHLLRVPLVRRLGAMKMKGAAGQKRVPADFFASLQIPVPPLEEQKRIASILDAADELRAKRRRALAELDSLLQSVFLDMFGDPVTNPKGWEVRILGELATNEDGRRIPIKKADRESIHGQYPYYGASGIIDYVNDFIFDGERLLIGEDGANLVARSTPIAFIAKGKYWVNNHAHVLKFNGKAELLFLEQFINAMDLKPFISGTAQPKLNQSKLNQILIPTPPLELQQKFAAIVEKVEQQKARMKEHLAELDALFASLQHRAFNGEL